MDDTGIQFVTIHGYRRAYRMAGSGPALLLLHGIGDSSLSWEPLMPALAERYTVIAPDLLGHGASDRPRADYSVAAYANGMRDLLEVVGVERATVVGHSLGGGVAAQFAYQYPERCERLVLIANGGVARGVTPLLRVASLPLAEFVLPVLQLPLGRLGTRLLIDAMRVAHTDLGRDSTELRRIFGDLSDTAARVAFIRTLHSVVDWRGQAITLRDRAYLTEALPILIVWGAHDGIIPVHHAYAAHAAMPHSRLSIYDEAGHFPHHTDSARFLAELDEFVATTEPLQFSHERWRTLLRSGGRPGPEPTEVSAGEPAGYAAGS